MDIQTKMKLFEEARPQLTGVAYRMLGSISEAEDIIQDTAETWIAYDGIVPNKPAAWLTTVCTNKCLDLLKSAHRTRVDYIGPWIPEQFETESTDDASEHLEMVSSLTAAFLLLLERLTPRERAAYLLHDIFGMSFEDIANSLGLKADNCRKLASRARKLVSEENARFVPSQESQKALLSSFCSAVKTGNVTELAALLSKDVNLRADSGGKVTAIRHILEGLGDVLDFIGTVLNSAWSNTEIQVSQLNGQPALLVVGDGAPHAAVMFSHDESGLVRSIFIIRNPEKLAQILTKKGVVIQGGGLQFNAATH